MTSTTVQLAHEGHTEEEHGSAHSQLFRDCVFFVCPSYEPALKSNIESLVKSMGAQVNSSLTAEVTHLITRYQTTNDFIQAMKERDQNRITIATVHWIEDCMIHQTVIPPITETEPQIVLPCAVSTVLHYPLRSKNGIPEMRSLKISLSGFVERDRMDMRSLIVASGAQFTQHLDRHNTHLIINDSPLDGQMGRKYVKAREWGVLVLTRQWIQECLIHWKHISEVQFLYSANEKSSDSTTTAAQISNPTTMHRISKEFSSPDKKRRDFTESATLESNGHHSSPLKKPRLTNGQFDREAHILNVLNQHLESTEFHFEETIRQCDEIPNEEVPATIRQVYESTLACVERMFLKTVERISSSPTSTSASTPSPPRRHQQQAVFHSPQSN